MAGTIMYLIHKFIHVLRISFVGDSALSDTQPYADSTVSEVVNSTDTTVGI